MNRSVKRILTNLASLLLLSAGSLFTIFFFGNVTLSRDFKVGTRFVTLFAVILIAIILVIEVSSLVLNKGAKADTVFISLCCLLFILSSRDSINMVAHFGEVPYPIIFDIVHSISFFSAIFFIMRFYCFSYGVATFNVARIGFCLLAIVGITDMVLLIFNLQFISSLIILNISLFIYFSFFFYTYIRKKVDNTFVVTGFIFFILAGGYIATGAGNMYNNYPLGLESWGMIVIFALFLMIYADYIAKMIKKSYATQEYEKKIKELQSAILMEQINPHFIFNSLVLIKSIYLEDKARGDRAIDLLSKHIRANVDVKGGKLLIPIDEELKNIECIVELANMQNEKPINMMFNIDAYDFMVPILSIEPFIENAIKYSRIQSKEDGFIELSTEETDNYYVIKVTDNGVGFTKEDLAKGSSQGIKNALSRFEFFLQAETRVDSKPNEGTTITIKIPKAGR